MNKQKKLPKCTKYKCPQCHKIGFCSIYLTLHGEDQCTNCANMMRYKNHTLSRKYYEYPIKEKHWWEFWK